MRAVARDAKKVVIDIPAVFWPVPLCASSAAATLSLLLGDDILCWGQNHSPPEFLAVAHTMEEVEEIYS